MEDNAWSMVDATSSARLDLDAADAERMEASARLLAETLAAGDNVYGLTRGFGPLVAFSAGADDHQQGLNLINHLAAGQGEALAPSTTRLMLRLRLEGMKHGYSGIDPASWSALAQVYNAGFIPVVPSKGSVSASGDLIPLAHAALAFAGEGKAWRQVGDEWQQAAAVDELVRLGLQPVVWRAREALAFVNGSSASLAIALENHVSLARLAWVGSVLTGQIIEVLGASAEPYSEDVVRARGNLGGHDRVSRWIRDELTDELLADRARALQEPYSLRCAPQVIGSVLDHLWASERLLVQESQGCSDNPVVSATHVWHAGNFHAANAGIASDQHAVLAHQLAFLAERQLAVIVDPAQNGGLPALLASAPGATSGLAGVQLAASGLVAEIRQKSLPATSTAIPTNLSNQDIVPMSLMSGVRTRAQIELVELVMASLAVAVAQACQISGPVPTSGLWAEIIDACPRLEADRPLSAEIVAVRDILLAYADRTADEREAAFV